jgi:SAM-dependent methyltransferase
VNDKEDKILKITYSTSWYKQYEIASSNDGLKKILEHAAFEELLADFTCHGDSLDIGTATGRYMRVADELGFSAYGIDNSPHAVSITQEYIGYWGMPTERVHLMDGASMGFKNECFQLVTCMMSTISHSYDYLAILTEVSRVLALDGIFVVSIWQPNTRFGGFLAVNTSDINNKLKLLCEEIGSLNLVLNAAGLEVINKKDAIFFDSDFYFSCQSDCCEKMENYYKESIILDQRLRNENDGQGGELGIYLCRKQTV